MQGDSALMAEDFVLPLWEAVAQFAASNGNASIDISANFRVGRCPHLKDIH